MSTTPVFHCDTGTILSHEYTADKYLRVYGRVAKVGDLIYRDGDRARTEYVSRDVLFAKDSIDSLKMIPITLDHPSGVVTPENARDYQRGMTGHAVVIDGDFLGITMTITDQETIDAIVSGEKQELSCGYRATVAQKEDGSWEQTSRNYNHVAAVTRGRAGPDVRVMLDSADAECWVADSDPDLATPPDTTKTATTSERVPLEESKASPQRRDMARQFSINNEIITVEDKVAADAISSLLGQLEDHKKSDDADQAKLATLGYASYADAIDALNAKLDAAEAEKAEMTTKLDAAEGKAVGLELQLKQKADEAPETVNTDADEIAQIKADAEAKISDEVKARMDAWAEVSDRLPKDFNVDHSLDVSGIYKAYLIAAHPNVNLDGKDAAYIEGLYQGLSVGTGSANKAEVVRNAVHDARSEMKGSDKSSAMGKETTIDTKAKRNRPLPGTQKEAC